MKASDNRTERRLLFVTSFCDRPEREIFCRLAEHISLSILCDPDNPGQQKLKDSGVNVLHYVTKEREQLAGKIIGICNESSIDCVYAPRTKTLAASIKALSDSDLKLVGYRGTTGHLSLVDLGPRFTYTHPRINNIICVSDAVARYL